MFLKKKKCNSYKFSSSGTKTTCITPTGTYVAFLLLLFFEKGNFCIAVIYHTLHSPEITQGL